MSPHADDPEFYEWCREKAYCEHYEIVALEKHITEMSRRGQK